MSLQWEPEVIAVALMYLAGKLSKFEVVDWAGRQPNHLRWWDMFVEGVTMDLLEGKNSSDSMHAAQICEIAPSNECFLSFLKFQNAVTTQSLKVRKQEGSLGTFISSSFFTKYSIKSFTVYEKW